MMCALRRLSCPSFFHPSTNRRIYRLLSNGLIGEPCGLPRPFVPIARASTLISALVRFLDRSFQSHLDQMEHGSIYDPASYRLHKLGMRKSIKVAAEICIYDFSMASVDQLMDVSYGVQCAAVFPIGVLFRLQVGFEYGFEHQNCGHFRCPVADSGYS